MLAAIIPRHLVDPALVGRSLNYHPYRPDCPCVAANLRAMAATAWMAKARLTSKHGRRNRIGEVPTDGFRNGLCHTLAAALSKPSRQLALAVFMPGRLFCFVLFCFVLFCFVLFCFVLFCFVLFCFVWFCLVWFGLVWFGLVWFGLVLFCFVLFCFVLFCFVLFCFVLFCSVSPSSGSPSALHSACAGLMGFCLALVVPILL